MARVRDEAVTMVRTLIRLAETMKPIPEVSKIRFIIMIPSNSF